MPKVALNMPAPDFTLDDFRRKSVQLTDLTREHNVLLVFNRGFA